MLLFELCLHLLVLLYDKDTSLTVSSTPGDQRRVKVIISYQVIVGQFWNMYLRYIFVLLQVRVTTFPTVERKLSKEGAESCIFTFVLAI